MVARKAFRGRWSSPVERFGDTSGAPCQSGARRCRSGVVGGNDGVVGDEGRSAAVWWLGLAEGLQWWLGSTEGCDGGG